jgi:CheY-like chemotaxis protein
MARALTACGYRVIAASDGREALARYDSGHAVDLVVLDMVMPGMGGRECMESLLKINPKVRVLVTTGYTSDGSANDLLTAGALAIIEKPLDLKVFAETVQRTIGMPADARRLEE